MIKFRLTPIVMVGAFPPPVHGMAAVNAAVRDAVQRAGATPLVIDVAGSGLQRSLMARLGRLPKVLRGLARLVRRRGLRGGALYMSVSGGLGQLYEIAFLLVARLRSMRVFMHHHSFAYLEKPNELTRALIRAAGDEAVHITQSPGMGERLKGRYGVARTVAVSNAVFFSATEAAGAARKEPKTLGFLSNIAPEKGVFEFLELMASADRAGLLVCGKLAGPFQDAATERAVRARLATLPRVQYLGPQYGAAKDAFYAGIDILVFPTRYGNETEGIVNHEAMCRGIPVIAFGRGCIPEIVGPDCGLVIDPAVPFVPAALAQLERWVADPGAFQAASKAASARFANTLAENQVRWRVLLAEIVGSDGALAGAGKETSR